MQEGVEVLYKNETSPHLFLLSSSYPTRHQHYFFRYFYYSLQHSHAPLHRMTTEAMQANGDQSSSPTSTFSTGTGSSCVGYIVLRGSELSKCTYLCNVLQGPNIESKGGAITGKSSVTNLGSETAMASPGNEMCLVIFRPKAMSELEYVQEIRDEMERQCEGVVPEPGTEDYDKRVSDAMDALSTSKQATMSVAAASCVEDQSRGEGDDSIHILGIEKSNSDVAARTEERSEDISLGRGDTEGSNSFDEADTVLNCRTGDTKGSVKQDEESEDM